MTQENKYKSKTLEKRKTLLSSLKDDREDLLARVSHLLNQSQVDVLNWAYNQRIKQIELEISKLKLK